MHLPLQSVLRNIERQIQEFQRQQQQQDLQAEFEHHHKLPVDIQIGDQVRRLQRTPGCSTLVLHAFHCG
jgi:hypothetical protein